MGTCKVCGNEGRLYDVSDGTHTVEKLCIDCGLIEMGDMLKPPYHYKHLRADKATICVR